MNLSQVTDGESAVIESVPDGEAGQRLEALGLRAGKKIEKISEMPFGGPVTVMLDGRHFAFSCGIASDIIVHTERSCR